MENETGVNETSGNFRTLRIGGRTMSYDAGIDGIGVSHSRRTLKNRDSDVMDYLDQDDDGIGTSDDDSNASHGEDSIKSLSSRMVIKPDPSLIGNLLNFDEEEEDDEDEEEEEEKGGKSVEPPRKSSTWQRIVAKDLVELSPRSLERRHSITLCKSGQRRRKNSISSSAASETPKSELSPRNSIEGDYEDEVERRETDEDEPYLRTCNLQLEEVAHIRSVLTKAELEALPIDNDIRSDVQRGKICFVCMKTKFGLFYRGQKCDMCKQIVCTKCHAKTRIPKERFESTPVFTLSPSVLMEGVPAPPNASNSDNIADNRRLLPPSRKYSPPCFVASRTVGSAPNSPDVQRRYKGLSTISGSVDDGPPVSLPVDVVGDSAHRYSTLPNKTNRRASLIESRVMARERLEGHLLNVCMDCKDMILQVIRASSRRVKSSAGYNVG